MFVLERFQTWGALTETAADRLVDALSTGLRKRERAWAALSGGSTPGDIYHELSRRPLPWERITVTLTDERWVDASSPDSNARLLRETLLQHAAASASLLSLKPEAATEPAQAAAEVSLAFAGVLPLDAALLGMGLDGHFASLFPGNPALAAGLAPIAPPCIAVPSGRPAPTGPRLSLTLPVLVGATSLLLVIRGDEKLEVLRRAATIDDASGAAPISALLRSVTKPLPVLWAP